MRYLTMQAGHDHKCGDSTSAVRIIIVHGRGFLLYRIKGITKTAHRRISLKFSSCRSSAQNRRLSSSDGL